MFRPHNYLPSDAYFERELVKLIESRNERNLTASIILLTLYGVLVVMFFPLVIQPIKIVSASVLVVWFVSIVSKQLIFSRKLKTCKRYGIY